MLCISLWFVTINCHLFQASRDYVVGQILMACSEIIKTVETKPNETGKPSAYPPQPVEQVSSITGTIKTLLLSELKFMYGLMQFGKYGAIFS